MFGIHYGNSDIYSYKQALYQEYMFPVAFAYNMRQLCYAFRLAFCKH